jgi:tight adherence protein C
MTSLGLTDFAYAIVLGGALGIGTMLLLSLTPRVGAPSLSRRIAPYIRDVIDPRGESAASAAVGGDLASLWRGALATLSRALGGTTTVQGRLERAGWSMDAAAFRGRQLGAAIGGLVLGGAVLVALTLTGRGSAVAWLLPPILAVLGVVGTDMLLTRAAGRRAVRITEELPTVLEFLALCLSAGEGILDSLRRVSQVGSGELTHEIRGVVVAVGTGSSLSNELTRFSSRLGVAPLSRAVDQLVAAIDRGAPLAQVLHAQAQDARDDAKRALIESAGRKEITMLVPLVFAILPLSVLFAVFPGIFMLRLGIG